MMASRLWDVYLIEPLSSILQLNANHSANEDFGSTFDTSSETIVSLMGWPRIKARTIRAITAGA